MFGSLSLARHVSKDFVEPFSYLLIVALGNIMAKGWRSRLAVSRVISRHLLGLFHNCN